jgi:prefoldin alpha subunit
LQKYEDARFALTPLTAAAEGRELLVPLSPGLCVMGNVSDVDSVLCDVGTGYYVEKSVADANEFIARKSELTRQHLQQVQRAIQQKVKHVEHIENVARAKAAAGGQ